MLLARSRVCDVVALKGFVEEVVDDGLRDMNP
jgi:hypothetical protein